MNKHIPCKRCSGRGFINWTFSEGNTGTATSYVCPDCNGSGVSVVPMTNADRIRAMSDEEMAEWVTSGGNCVMTICDHICGGKCNAIKTFKKSSEEACKEIVMKWLQQPAEEDKHEAD